MLCGVCGLGHCIAWSFLVCSLMMFFVLVRMLCLILRGEALSLRGAGDRIIVFRFRGGLCKFDCKF